MFDTLFGITPISETMWFLLFLGMIGSVLIGVAAGFRAWLKNK